MGIKTASTFDDNDKFIVVRRNGRKGRRSHEKGERVSTTFWSLEDPVSVERIDTVMKNACRSTELINYR